MARSPTRFLLVGAASGFAASAALPFALVADTRPQPATLVEALLAAVFVGAALLWPRPAPPPRAEMAAPPDAAPPPPPPPKPDVDIESLADPVLLIEERTIAHANAAARALFGDRIVGADVRVALRHPAMLDAVAQARELGRPVTREAAGLGRPDAVFRLRAVASEDGGALLTLTDMSQARRAERMRVDFVANASHELRTPLTTLLGFIETLQGPAADDEPARARFLEIMAREANRMSRLIDDLMSLSRIELDKYVPPQGVVDLAPVVADVERTLAERLRTGRRKLLVELPDELPPVIADRDQLLQVLHNLVSNALKYGRTGTPIAVRAEAGCVIGRGEPAVRVSVVDEGEGIAPEHLPRLTERFYRVNDAASRNKGGTGLGLAIVKHIVERHRGELTIESKPGVGTEVGFTLPVARDVTAAAPAVAQPQPDVINA